ncbi:MAG: anthranilate synthase component I family protein [Chlamydiales bacterium]
MSMPYITTWTFSEDEPLAYARAHSDLEGTVFLYSADKEGRSFLALNPDQKIEASDWETLETLGEDHYFGFLSYEMGCFADVPIPYHPSTLPLSCFYRPTTLIVFDHATQCASLYGRPVHRGGQISLPYFELTGSSETYSSYIEKVRYIQERIRCGDVYQVNFSQEFYFEGEGDPFALFESCVAANPVPYSAFVRGKEFALVSLSPEMFLTAQGNHLTTAPIKGTAPRGETPEEDAMHRARLLNSPKERAELMMIVDLLRNDLGKICRPGSIEVTKLSSLLTYSNVFHLVAEICGNLRTPLHPMTLLRHFFPGGSISGCPKLAAMELISALEKTPRGPYTGCIGRIQGGKEMQFNLAIRTLVAQKERLSLRLGGAIVADSDPDLEYAETIHKGKTFLERLNVHSLSRR